MDVLNDTRNATPPPIPLNFTALASELLARWRYAELADYHGRRDALDFDDDPENWSAAEIAALRELAITDPGAFTAGLPAYDLDGDPMPADWFLGASEAAEWCADELRTRGDDDDLSIECDRCDGAGIVERIAWDWTREDVTYADERCDRCGGTGDMGVHAAGEAVRS